jgi:DNA-binding MarR family transcriptional regulator
LDVAARLQSEIKQSKPFRAPEEEAFLNVLRTGEALMQGVAAVLKPFGLSPTQYNVLRILRGAGAAGLACREIGERMVTHDPDITRLLDRLEARRLVSRSRDRKDRRVITIRITEGGLELAGQLDEPIRDLHRKQLGHLGAARLRTLTSLLEAARSRIQ